MRSHGRDPVAWASRPGRHHTRMPLRPPPINPGSSEAAPRLQKNWRLLPHLERLEIDGGGVSTPVGSFQFGLESQGAWANLGTAVCRQASGEETVPGSRIGVSAVIEQNRRA